MTSYPVILPEPVLAAFNDGETDRALQSAIVVIAVLFRIEVAADSGIDAGRASASRLDAWALARQPVHVRRWTSEVRNDAGESGYGIANLLHFFEDRIF